MGQVEPPSLSTFDFFLFPPTSSFSFSYLKSFDMEISSRETSLFFLFAAVDVITHNRLRCVECSSFLRRPFPPPSPTTTTSIEANIKVQYFLGGGAQAIGSLEPTRSKFKMDFFFSFCPSLLSQQEQRPEVFSTGAAQVVISQSFEDSLCRDVNSNREFESRASLSIDWITSVASAAAAASHDSIFCSSSLSRRKSFTSNTGRDSRHQVPLRRPSLVQY